MMKTINKIMTRKNKLGFIGAFIVLCSLAGITSCYADEMKVESRLINCVKNGYYNVSNIDSKITSNTYVKDVLTEIYGVCYKCHIPGYYGHWYVGVWPTGSSTNAYDPSIVIDKLTNSEPVYLWSQVSLCGNSVSDYRSTFDMIINPLEFSDTGYHKGSFPYIDQGRLGGWNSLSRTVSQKYGSAGDVWGVHGDSHAATFDPITFSKDRRVTVSREVRDDTYYLLNYGFRSNFTSGGGCDGCVTGEINWGYEGISAFELNVQAKQAALIGLAVDYNGNRIDSMNRKSGTMEHNIMAENLVSYDPVNGVSASISRADPTGDYKFVGWRLEANGDIVSTNTVYSAVIKRNTTVYAVYGNDNVYGKVTIEGTSRCIDTDKMTSVDVGSLDYTQSNRNTRCTVSDCDSVVGCTVRFGHYLKGTGLPNYSINGAFFGYSPASLHSGNDRINNKNGVEVYSDSKTVYPGDVYCETLSFSPFAGKSTSIKMCVSVEGRVQPD